MIDRGDAVNLARDIRETDNIENITRKGILCLADAVLRMDQYIRDDVDGERYQANRCPT